MLPLHNRSNEKINHGDTEDTEKKKTEEESIHRLRRFSQIAFGPCVFNLRKSAQSVDRFSFFSVSSVVNPHFLHTTTTAA